MILDKFSLAGKAAIVTGGGRGIGKGIALAFADAGADVAVLARTTSEIEETSSQIKAMGRKSVAVTTDVRKADQVNEMVDRVAKEFGRIDILVNNAGGTFAKPFLELSEGGWDANIRENLTTLFLCCKTVVGIMVKQGSGCIINITSMAGTLGSPGLAPYAAAKAGVINLTQTLAAEFAPAVRVNVIAVGSVLTESFLKNFPGMDMEEQATKFTLMKRIGQPEDIALACIYLASDASSWVTGQTLYVNGGMRLGVG